MLPDPFTASERADSVPDSRLALAVTRWLATILNRGRAILNRASNAMFLNPTTAKETGYVVRERRSEAPMNVSTCGLGAKREMLWKKDSRKGFNLRKDQLSSPAGLNTRKMR